MIPFPPTLTITYHPIPNPQPLTPIPHVCELSGIEAGIEAFGSEKVGMAALLDGAIPAPRGPIVIVVSGSNIDIETHRRLIGAA